jgi:hypothetical protein
LARRRVHTPALPGEPDLRGGGSLAFSVKIVHLEDKALAVPGQLRAHGEDIGSPLLQGNPGRYLEADGGAVSLELAVVEAAVQLPFRRVVGVSPLHKIGAFLPEAPERLAVQKGLQGLEELVWG